MSEFSAHQTPASIVIGPEFCTGLSCSQQILVNTDNNIRLSKRRWLVLFALSVLGFSVALTNDTSPIFHVILKLLELNTHEYIYINQLFNYIMAAIAVPVAWLVDKYGIKCAIYTAAALFIMNGIVNALLYYPELPGWSNNKMYYFITSQFIGTMLFSIYILLPLKVSENWFSESERSVAWTFMISQLSVGVCIASFTFPRIMSKAEDVKILAYINIIFVFINALVTLTCVTKSEPEHPPNKRIAEASNDTKPFLVSIIKMLRHKSIVLHLIHMSIFESIGLSLQKILQDIFTSVGYSEIFAGNFMSVTALVTLVMTISLASFVHKLKNVTLTCKLGSIAQAVLFIVYLITLMLASPEWILITVGIIFTVCRSWAAPIFTNMTANLACGTVSQATVVGFSVTLTLIAMTVVQLIFAALMDVSGKVTNYSKSLFFLVILSIINSAIYIIFFGQSLKTLEGDQQDETIEST